jgi:hypothetical protein
VAEPAVEESQQAVTMSSAQFDAIREQQLTLRKTILSGDLHVVDVDGRDWLLNRAGELEPFDLERGVRVDLTDPPPA